MVEFSNISETQETLDREEKENVNEREEEGKKEEEEEEEEEEARYYAHDVEGNNISLNFLYIFSVFSCTNFLLSFHIRRC